jgi:hypothetical protein
MVEGSRRRSQYDVGNRPKCRERGGPMSPALPGALHVFVQGELSGYAKANDQRDWERSGAQAALLAATIH